MSNVVLVAGLLLVAVVVVHLWTGASRLRRGVRYTPRQRVVMSWTRVIVLLCGVALILLSNELAAHRLG